MLQIIYMTMFCTEKYKEVTSYRNDILFSFVFGRLYLDNQSVFNRFFNSALAYIIFSILGAMVIVPINEFVVQIIFYMIQLVAKVFIFFIFLHVLSILLSMVFPAMVKVPLILPKNYGAIFLLILFIADFYYIISLNIQLEVFKIDYNICTTISYLVLANAIFITYFLLSKLFIETYNKITRVAMEYYYDNYDKLDNDTKNDVFKEISESGKKFRLYTIILIVLLSFKFLHIIFI